MPGLAEQVFCREDLELDLVDRQQVFQRLHLGHTVLDLAVERVPERDRMDGTGIGSKEFVHQAGRVGKARMHDRQAVLLRCEDDEAPVDLERIEIVGIAELGCHLRREAGDVDIEFGELGAGQAEGAKRLVVARDEMRLANGKQAAIDEFGFEEAVHAVSVTFLSSCRQ